MPYRCMETNLVYDDPYVAAAAHGINVEALFASVHACMPVNGLSFEYVAKHKDSSPIPIGSKVQYLCFPQIWTVASYTDHKDKHPFKIVTEKGNLVYASLDELTVLELH